MSRIRSCVSRAVSLFLHPYTRGSPPTGMSDEQATTEIPEPDADLVARIEEASPEQTAREIATLRERLEQLESELAESETAREELESKLTRKQADFQNFKKRQQKRTQQVRERATEDLVERLVGVRDNLVRALDEEGEIRDGVETTLRQFDEVLNAENVAPIEPEVGTELDPQRHEVLMAVESDAPEGTVADLHRPGYEMADTVLRPAQVTVAE
ncbi:nucleotide exchange factor GrpE [Halobacteriales archaeon SW_8_65_20]|nr:MAG: nucleotide exchange factor GrpE [Halobacteriales archaeon SW_8_65_20]